MRLRTVGEVAELSGVTVRTLHHYDDVGLLEPSERTSAGYRLYSDADLLRLHSILNWRDMGFSLTDIADMLDDPAQDLSTGLEKQRERLTERSARLQDMIAALDDAISTIERGRTMTDNGMQKIFDGFDPADHEAEVENRWGNTDSYTESRRRTSSYTEKDWKRQRTESDDNVAAFAALLREGAATEDARTADAAREHGAIIDRWFYPLTPEAHVGLAQTYVTDPRFEALYEKVETGLARYVSEAILALHSD
jgi:DNA-binding transcriptional MerR regulator